MRFTDATHPNPGHAHAEHLLRGFKYYLCILLGFLVAKLDSQYDYGIGYMLGVSVDEVFANKRTIDVTATVVSMSIFPFLSCSDSSCRDEWNQCYEVPESGNIDEAIPIDCENDSAAGASDTKPPIGQGYR